jgi:hypothetical protein
MAKAGRFGERQSAEVSASSAARKIGSMADRDLDGKNEEEEVALRG